MVPDWITSEAPRAVARIGMRIDDILSDRPKRLAEFRQRVDRVAERLFRDLHMLYGWRYDFFHHFEQVLLLAADHVAHRRRRWYRRDRAPDARAWVSDRSTLWGMLYPEQYAGTLSGITAHADHLESLGVTHLHIMPPYATPQPENDGGYAVSDYHRVRPGLGTMADLAGVVDALDGRGVGVVLDLVANHTADNHVWAQRARAGNPMYQDFYLMYDDRSEPDRYQAHLRAIFPDRPGDSFVWRPDVTGPADGKWVWSTFYPYQWDLNYANPDVLVAMTRELIHLLSLGPAAIRLDATPFLWKRPGTNCENLEEAHAIIRIWNAVVELAAPSVELLSEAIVHPDDVQRYVRDDECRLGYNPSVMASLWESVATGDTRLLRKTVSRRMRRAPGTGWLTYVRCHDDIGWGFDDSDVVDLGLDPIAHRAYLNSFYSGEFPGTFARGLLFQRDPTTGDARISGTLASLAGIECALTAGDADALESSIRRIVALFTVQFAVGGIPLLYLGDEVGQLNDYLYVGVEGHAEDNRWAHRPQMPWAAVTAARDAQLPEAALWNAFRRLVALRRSHDALGVDSPEVLPISAREVLGLRRRGSRSDLLVVVNLSDRDVIVPTVEFGSGPWHPVGGGPALPSGSVGLTSYEVCIWEQDQNRVA